MNDEMDPELLDADVHRMEQEEPPRPHPGLVYQELCPEHAPILTDKDYKLLRDCYLQPEHGARDIQPNVVYYTRDKDGVHYKFLLLKGVLLDSYMKAKLALEAADWDTASRSAAKGQPNAKKLTVGWYAQLPGHIEGRPFDSLRNRATLDQPGLMAALRPLVRAMDRAVEEYLPTYYYPTALPAAMKAVRREDEPEAKYLEQVRNNPNSPLPEKDVAVLKGMDMMGWVPDMAAYMLWGTIFSTIELNRHIVFRAHEDANNAEGTLVCITGLGTWVGGRVIFPRYGYGADLAPTDLLICDNLNELHGNLGPMVGHRYSVVAFLHQHVLDYANEQGQWAAKTSTNTETPIKPGTPTPFTYTPNFLTKEETNELDAYFDTLTFDVRYTKPWNKRIKRESIGYIAQNAFNDRENWGTDYADIDTAPEILQRFRLKLAAYTGREINYMSILKYPDGKALINWHNHKEDLWHDSPVWDVTVGPTERRFWAREVANPKTTVSSVLAEVGSLVTLPASMNTTHHHAILPDKTTGVRYSINCKSLPLYGVWDCHSGKNYPKKGVNFHEDSVYVGCKTTDWKGNILREGTRFGNGADPFVSPDGGFATEAEFRKEAERRMQDPAFRAELEKLRGKHLLCWCVQTGPKREDFCHARVWLEIANRKDPG